LIYEQQPPQEVKAIVPKEVTNVKEDPKWCYTDLISRKPCRNERVECHSRIEQFVHLFVERKMEIHLARLLEQLIQTGLQANHPSGLVVSDVAIETYFELLLKQLWYKLKRFPGCEDIPFIEEITEDRILSMLKTLSASQLKYSDDHLLILFQTYDVKSCVIVTL